MCIVTGFGTTGTETAGLDCTVTAASAAAVTAKRARTVRHAAPRGRGTRVRS